ncbi:MAG: hypothetical protein DRJ64_02685 [Thermoprotei archaeon]|nr:MAG: hypothetical protein DRJ64_02685 [Thermoprotei archaeon]
MANTIIYQEEWAIKLQERLDAPENWKEICKVEYTNDRVLHNPYSTDATVQSGTRGSAYTHQDVTFTDDSITINQFKILPQLIDRADLAQSTYAKQMELAAAQGTLLNEAIETAMLASHASWTNFDNASIGGSAGNITVSATNIDDIIRGLKREIREANGQKLANRRGIFIVWRAADFEILEAFVQANGFSTADNALKDGTVAGFKYMGVDHYVSNSHAAGHLFAGIKDTFHLGIVKETYGQVIIDNEPATGSGAVSGIGIVSRVDYAFKAWNNTKPVLFDVLVA